MPNYQENRAYLKTYLWEDWTSLKLDQMEGIPRPPIQKPYPSEAKLVDLVPANELTIGNMSVLDAINKRQSHRNYNGEPITQEELSFLLWCTQGVRKVIRGGQTVLKTAPSAGALHPFETYIFVNHVEEIETGLYRYLGIEHKLLLQKKSDSLVHEIHNGTYKQYVIDSAVVFIWTVLPYRTEWRYGPLAHKMIAQDSGHVCQNLYIACESINVGTCAIGAYNQTTLDQVLDLDGNEEFTIYVATVGKMSP